MDRREQWSAAGKKQDNGLMNPSPWLRDQGVAILNGDEIQRISSSMHNLRAEQAHLLVKTRIYTHDQIKTIGWGYLKAAYELMYAAMTVTDNAVALLGLAGSSTGVVSLRSKNNGWGKLTIVPTPQIETIPTLVYELLLWFHTIFFPQILRYR